MEVERICPVCGETYNANTNRLKYGRQTTCGRSCSYKLRAAQRQTRITLTCSVCGEKFERSPAQIKSKHKGVYCSRACHYKGRSAGLTERIVTASYTVTPEGKQAHRQAGKRAAATRRKNGNHRHTEATKERLRHKTAQAIASGKFPRVSKIETVVAKELSRLGFNAIHQYGVRNPATGRYVACLDFFLPDLNLAIEVNGTFWHADPRVYDRTKLTPAQERTQDRYTSKVALLQELGIPLIEIWESDIKQSVQNAISDALGRFI